MAKSFQSCTKLSNFWLDDRGLQRKESLKCSPRPINQRPNFQKKLSQRNWGGWISTAHSWSSSFRGVFFCGFLCFTFCSHHFHAKFVRYNFFTSHPPAAPKLGQQIRCEKCEIHWCFFVGLPTTTKQSMSRLELTWGSYCLKPFLCTKRRSKDFSRWPCTSACNKGGVESTWGDLKSRHSFKTYFKRSQEEKILSTRSTCTS